MTVTIVEGNNELNVAMTPIAPLSPTYSQPSVSFDVYGPYTLVEMTVVVTNPNLYRISGGVYCHWRWTREPETVKKRRYFQDVGVPDIGEQLPDYYRLYLEAGESRQIVSPYAYLLDNLVYTNAPYIGLTSGDYALLWFEDSLGGMSVIMGPY